MEFERDRIKKLRLRLKECYKILHQNDPNNLIKISSERVSESNPFLQSLSMDLINRFGEDIKGFSPYTLKKLFFDDKTINYEKDTIGFLEAFCDEVEKENEHLEKRKANESKRINDNSKSLILKKIINKSSLLIKGTLILFFFIVVVIVFKNNWISKELKNQEVTYLETLMDSIYYDKSGNVKYNTPEYFNKGINIYKKATQSIYIENDTIFNTFELIEAHRVGYKEVINLFPLMIKRGDYYLSEDNGIGNNYEKIQIFLHDEKLALLTKRIQHNNKIKQANGIMHYNGSIMILPIFKEIKYDEINNLLEVLNFNNSKYSIDLKGKCLKNCDEYNLIMKNYYSSFSD